MTDKKMSETGSKIEKGESVQARLSMDVAHAIWLATMGETGGFGKLQWRELDDLILEAVN